VSGGRVQLLTTDDHLRHSLVISDVQQSDAGDYMVKLTDHLDPSLVHSSTAKLIIIPHRPVSGKMISTHHVMTIARHCNVIATFGYELNSLTV